MKKGFRRDQAEKRESGQSMIEYLLVLLFVIVLLLAPYPESKPESHEPPGPPLLTLLSEALRGFYSDYSAAVSKP